ncbi:MAG: tetratricopeptide repeat protein [Spirochaetales bacterium]|nr:tetratricopeptide repeat protein [Spirochaetales bacterium]
MKKRILFICAFLFACFTAFANEDAKIFEQAEWRFRSGEYEIALEHYEQLIRKFPLSDYMADSQFRRGVCLFKLGQYEEALRVFRRVESRYLSTKYYSLLPFWIGVSSYKLGEFVEAERLLTQFLAEKFDPLARETYLYLALSQKNQGKFQEALDNVMKLTDLNVEITDDPVSFALAVSLMVQLEKYQEAIDLIDSVSLDKLDSASRDNINFYKAEAFFSLNKLQEAEALYLTMTGSSANNIKSLAYQRLFSIYSKSPNNPKLERLIIEAEKELQNDREFLDSFWTRIAVDKYNNKDYEAAQVYLLKIWNSTDTKNLGDLVPLYLAESFFKTEKYDRAIEVLESFISFVKGDKQIFYFRLADYYSRLVNWEKALEYSSLVQPKTKYSDSSALIRGTALINLGRYQDAVNFLEGYSRENPGFAASSSMLKLRADAFRKLGKLEEASSLLFQFLEKNKNDEQALYNYMIVNFKLGRYSDSLEISNRVEAVAKSRKRVITTYYVRGLCQIALGNYEGSLESLGKITLVEMETLGLSSLLGYVRFYRGWAAYRLGMYEESYNIFVSIKATEVSPDLYIRSSYYAGWAAFSLGKFDLASEAFSKYSMITSGKDSQQGKYLMAKSLAESGDYDGAEKIFKELSKDKDSNFSDDAAFDYANMLSSTGKVEKAVLVLDQLAEDFPDSPHAEFSLFRRGEILFLDQKYEEAREAFLHYRNTYPLGQYVDASLYWGGMCSFMLGTSSGALLLWEQLYSEHKNSIFLPDTITRMAEIHLERNNWDRSEALYRELIRSFPEAAISASADSQLQRISLLKEGKYDKEAEILANVRAKGGFKTAAGRAAMLDLGDLYINIYSDAKKRDQAFEDMKKVAEMASNEPETRAKAYFLIANYYYKMNDFKNAGDYYIKAASEKVKNSDFLAESLYRAVKTAVVAGSKKDAENIYKIMKQRYPSSRWTESAAKLLE